jgi:hypothetical protein
VNAAVDLSTGLSPTKESVLAVRPDVAHWSENLAWAFYDPVRDLGFWLHLGTMPGDWGIWEDRVLVAMPTDQGVFTQRSYLRTPPERRPGAANLVAECLEPFRRWRVTFDGFAVRVQYERMRTGIVTDGLQEQLSFELEITSEVPVWDMHAAATHETGRGSMAEQGWASEHYEQAIRAVGTTHLPSGEVAVDATGWRDHSRGPRGPGTGKPWFGHVIMGAYLPGSRRAVGLCSYYGADGRPSLEGGYLVQDGVLHHAQVLEAPRLTRLQRDRERLRFGLRSELGDLHVDAVTATSLFTMLRYSRQCYGIDPTGELGMVFVHAFARWEWDGEPATLYVERSDPLAEVGSPS